MSDVTYYVVGEDLERKDGGVQPKREYLATRLDVLYESNTLFIDSLEEWTEQVLANPVLQTALNISLAVAEPWQVESYGEEVNALRGIERVRQAKAEYEAAILGGKRDTVEYFSANISSGEEAASFLKRHRMNANQFSHWVSAVVEDAANPEKARDWQFNPVAARSLAEAWIEGTAPTRKPDVRETAQYKKLKDWAK